MLINMPKTVRNSQESWVNPDKILTIAKHHLIDPPIAEAPYAWAFHMESHGYECHQDDPPMELLQQPCFVKLPIWSWIGDCEGVYLAYINKHHVIGVSEDLSNSLRSHLKIGIEQLVVDMPLKDVVALLQAKDLP